VRSDQVGGGHQDWWRGAVLYQVYLRSFRDSDGDGVGDLPGLIAGLDHLRELGVDAVWVTPFFASPMRDFGYDVSDHRAVDPVFGGLDDVDRLLAEAQARGLRVLFDLVLSHTSDQHPWFLESRRDRVNPRADWYVWAEPRPDGTPPNNWLSVFGGSAWRWEPRRRQYYLHNFLAEQPDLNFYAPAVREAQLDVARFWLDRGVDGFRLDAINALTHDPRLRDNPAIDVDEDPSTPDANPYRMQDHVHDKNQPETARFLESFRALLDRYPGAVALGEIGDAPWRALRRAAEYCAPGRLHSCYTFDLLGARFDAEHLAGVVARHEEALADGWPCWSWSNHDVARHVSRLRAPGASRSELARLACTLLLSLRGTPCLYQGEELGLPEAAVDFDDLVDPYGLALWPDFAGRDGCRTPIPWRAGAPHAGFSEARPWLPLAAEHHGLAVDQQARDAHSTLAHYRRALAFRRAHPALARGDLTPITGEGAVLAFERRHEDERLIAAFNLSNDEVHWEPPTGVEISPLVGHGCAGRLDDGVVVLPRWDGFIGAATAAGIDHEGPPGP
jgi:alpha-glucosidase